MLDARHELADNVKRLFPPIPLKVAAGETLPVPFVETPPADKPADKSSDKPADKPAAKAAAAGGENLTRGFAVLIRDNAAGTRYSGSGKYWVQRVRFEPWKPSDFLEATLKYSKDRQQLDATLRAKEDAPFPLDTAANPILVRFATDPHQAELEAKPIKVRSRAPRSA